MWKNIVGIDSVGPAFEQIVIRPHVGGGLEWAKGTYESIRGPISVDWRKTGASLSISISIPPNSTATVYVPASGKSEVRESGNPIDDAAGVEYQRQENGCAVFAVDSGAYRFQSISSRSSSSSVLPLVSGSCWYMTAKPTTQIAP